MRAGSRNLSDHINIWMPIRKHCWVTFECVGRARDFEIDIEKQPLVLLNVYIMPFDCVNMHDLYRVCVIWTSRERERVRNVWENEWVRRIREKVAVCECERREVTCWHFDNNSSSTCVASVPFLLFQFHWIIYGMLSELSTTSAIRIGHLYEFLLIPFCSAIVIPSILSDAKPWHFRIHCISFAVLFCSTALSKSILNLTYIINFGLLLFFSCRIEFEQPKNKDENDFQEMCNCNSVLFIFFGGPNGFF